MVYGQPQRRDRAHDLQDKFLGASRPGPPSRLRFIGTLIFSLVMVVVSPQGQLVYSQSQEPGRQHKKAEHQPRPDAKSLRLVKRLQLPGEAKLGILRGQGKYLAVWLKDQTIQVWDINRGRKVPQLAAPKKLYGISLTGDGQRLVMVHSTSRLGYRNTVTVWDVVKGREVAVLKGRLSLDEAVHPQGRIAVAWGRPQKEIQVVDTASGKEISRFPLRETLRYHKPWMTFSPDGQRLAMGVHDVFPSQGKNLVAIHDVATGRVLALLDHTPKQKGQRYLPRDEIQVLDFSPDGRLLATGTTSTVRIWELKTGREVTHLEIPGGCSSLWFSPDGRLLATAVGRIVKSFPELPGIFESERTVKVWDTATGREVASLMHDDVVWTVHFSPKEPILATHSGDSDVRLWQADTGKSLASLVVPSLYSLNFQADGKHLVTWSKNNILQVWEFHPSQAESYPTAKEYHPLQKLTEVKRLDHGGPVWELCFSPKGNFLATAGEKTARVWEVAGGREVNHWEEPGRLTSLAFSPDGRWLATASGKEEENTEIGRITLWEVGKNRPKTLSSLSTVVWSLAFSPDSRWLVAGGNDAQARLFEVATGKEMMQMTHPEKNDQIQSMAYSPDGRYLATGFMDIFVWETASGRKVAQMGHERSMGGGTFKGGVKSMAFSPDGKWLATGAAENSVRLWEPASGREIACMNHGTAAEGSVDKVAFSPDGRYLVSGGDNRLARVWELPAGREVARVRHRGPVTAAVFSPCGRFVASSEECPGDLWEDPGCQALVRVWEMSTGQEVAQMAHDSGIQDLAFSPDAKLLSSASRDGTVRLWRWQPEELIR